MHRITKLRNWRVIFGLVAMLCLLGVGAIVILSYSLGWAGPPGSEPLFKAYRQFGAYRLVNGDTFTITQYDDNYGGYMGNYVLKYNSRFVSVVDPVHSPKAFCIIPVGTGEYWVYDVGQNGVPSFRHMICELNVKLLPTDWNIAPSKIKALIPPPDR